MKKTNIILILIAMLSLLGLGAVVLFFGDTEKLPEQNNTGTLEGYQDDYIADENMNKEIVVKVEEEFAEASEIGIYTAEFQSLVREKINGLISANT
ncbi:MAG: hypothetical protein J6K15_11480, partial [Lachnospiraceae bacterium]|nr:hypothetical protein [Lachnospiraceae bacterium]